MKRHILLLSMIVLPYFTLSQGKRFDSPYLNLLETSDEVYVNGKPFYILKSPLAVFNGYKTIFKEFVDKHRPISVLPIVGSSDYPWVEDKDYSIFWKIVNDSLYLSDIYFYEVVGTRKNPDQNIPVENHYRQIEQLTGGEFVKGSNAARVAPVSPYGVMPAKWVNGDFLVKRFPHDWMGTNMEQWDKDNPAVRMTSKNGVLIKMAPVRLDKP